VEKHEYVIGIKIETSLPLSFNSIPEIIREEISKGTVTILTAETYESWQEEQAAK
jgi:hypothetical protein